MNRSRAATILLALAVVYSVAHFVMSGVVFALRTPNVGQVVEELQPLYRLFTTGAATVDHQRQYGPIFLMLLHPIYRLDPADQTMLSRYAFALDLIAILIGFLATFDAIRTWAASRGVTVGGSMLLALGLLWANFSPLYGVLVIKNVELWELALIAVAGAAMLRGQRWVVAWSIAAAALVKMLPLVFIPYLLLRDRRTFAYTLVALGILLTISQALYGTAMGWGYLPAMVRAAAGGDGYGNALGMTWHENVSLRGIVLKAFGYLERPEASPLHPAYQLGYYVRILPGMQSIARALALAVEIVGALWVAVVLLRRSGHAEPARTFWDWALIGLMMLVLAPQISQDYMVLGLVSFSFVLAGCMLYGTWVSWIEFAIAVLLVGNVLPRGVFSRLVLIDPLMALTGYGHLMRAEAYQYFGFPLIGLLVLARTWMRLSEADVTPSSPGIAAPDARIVSL
jgi:hypothetical protein